RTMPPSTSPPMARRWRLIPAPPMPSPSRSGPRHPSSPRIGSSKRQNRVARGGRDRARGGARGGPGRRLGGGGGAVGWGGTRTRSPSEKLGMTPLTNRRPFGVPLRARALPAQSILGGRLRKGGGSPLRVG